MQHLCTSLPYFYAIGDLVVVYIQVNASGAVAKLAYRKCDGPFKIVEYTGITSIYLICCHSFCLQLH